jgi:hypothetical protein
VKILERQIFSPHGETDYMMSVFFILIFIFIYLRSIDPYTCKKITQKGVKTVSNICNIKV